MTVAENSDDQALLANTPAQAESLLHILGQAARDIGLYMNSDKIDFMCFNQDGPISSLNFKPVKLVDQCQDIFFHPLDSSVTLGEKVKWELRKNAACCFPQILEVTSIKKQLYGHLSTISQIILVRHSRPCWRSKDEIICDILR